MNATNTMNRTEFLAKLGLSAGAFAFINCLMAPSSSNEDTPTPANPTPGDNGVDKQTSITDR